MSILNDNDDRQPAVSAVIGATRHWLEAAVIGLNLCPFAKAVHVRGQVRYAVSDACSTEELRHDLAAELALLRDSPADAIDTTLLIHPWVLQDFLDYNDFLDEADGVLEDLGLVGELQVASFHPDYQFGDAEAVDIGNYTNRSPYPILHLLREDSIDRAVAAFPDAEEIYGRNIETLERLGLEGWRALQIGTGSKPRRGED